MKKILSVFLVLLLTLSTVPFAFANDDSDSMPSELISACYLQSSGENFTSVHFVLVLNETFVAATPALSVSVSHQSHAADAEETTDTFDGASVMVVPGTFLKDSKPVTRLQLIVPKTFNDSEYTTRLTIAAGKPNTEITLQNIYHGGIFWQGTYFSKIMQMDLKISDTLGVGVGDKITLNACADFPFEVQIDGKTLERVRGNEEVSLTFSVKEEGTHTIAFFYEGLLCSSFDFTVYSQMEIYNRQRKAAFSALGSAGLMALAPIAALPLAMILPPLGVAAMAGPVFSAMGALEAIFSVFRIVNLLRP